MIDLKVKVNTVTLDFETFYDSKQKYSLKNMSLVEYIHDSRFHIQGAGIKINAEPTRWYSDHTWIKEIDWANTILIAHHVKFDGAILSWKYGIKPKQYIDTLGLVKAILGNSIPTASLKHTAEALGLPAKGELHTNGKKDLTVEEEKELAAYCITDVDICYGIYERLKGKFPSNQWDILDWTARIFIHPQLEIDGQKCLEVYNKSIANKQQVIDMLGIKASVLRSNPQFAELLKAEGYKVPFKLNKRGEKIPALSIQDKAFLQLLKSNDPKLKQLCTARTIVKQTLEETRAKKMYELSKISKYCFDVIFSGALQTHRFSGGNGCAGNPQNFGRKSELRAALKAPEGKTLVVADFKNIELRVLAFLSNCQELMGAIKKQDDPYCKFASKIYNRSITKTDKAERFVGKAAVLGLGYGMGIARFIDQVYTQGKQTIDAAFSKTIIDLYRNTYETVPRFWKKCEDILEQISTAPNHLSAIPFLKLKKNTIVLPLGLEIKYHNLRFTWQKKFNRWKKEWVYDRYKSKLTAMDVTKLYGGKVTENLCQALAGDICKVAIQRLIKIGYPPVGQVHDELLVICNAEKEQEVKQIVHKAMTDPIDWWKELPLEVEIGTGNTWKESK